MRVFRLQLLNGERVFEGLHASGKLLDDRSVAGVARGRRRRRAPCGEHCERQSRELRTHS
jgi:hypothetical protein